MDFEEKLNFTKEESDLISRILNQNDGRLSMYATKDSGAVYAGEEKRNDRDIYRSNFGRDIDSILNNIFYARSSDKTQVHSFYKNDDLTRRALHVQLVSRIARNIGSILNLNLELIEAISIGHDIGHTPFGHRGEQYLSELYFNEDKKFFNHNVHSVRVLYEISKKANRQISLQVLDGVLSHNGEFLVGELNPAGLKTFQEFEKKYRACYYDNELIRKNIPNTLEGCLVRMCDIIAYIGKDRNDLLNIKQHKEFEELKELDRGLGSRNSTIIKNIITNLIKNSLDKPYIKLDNEVINAINQMKTDNKKIIYDSKEVVANYGTIQILFEKLFNVVLKDLKNGTDKSFVRSHFLNEPYLTEYNKSVKEGLYTNAEIAVDYIACMTDDYFIDLCVKMGFGERVKYTGYF